MASLTYGNAAWKGGPCGSISVFGRRTWGDLDRQAGHCRAGQCTYGGAHDPDTGAVSEAAGSRTSLSTPTTGEGLRGLGGRLLSAGRIGRIRSRVERQRPDLVTGRGDQQDSGAIDAFIPTVDVNSSRTVGVTYYDFRNNVAGRRRQHGRLATDLRHVLHERRRTGRRHTRQVRSTSRLAPDAGGEFIGDYMGMTTDGRYFEPFFIQTVSAPLNPTDAFFTTGP